MSRAALCVVLIAFAGFVAHGGARPACKEFKSAKFHFLVRYPASWHTLYKGDPTLDIINFPNKYRQPGIVISATGAWISIGVNPASVGTLDKWVRDSLQGSTPTSDREIRAPNASTNGCGIIREVTWLGDAGGVLGKKYYSNTAYYCSIRRKVFSVFLTNWEGDPKQEELRKTALKIAESLRTW